MVMKYQRPKWETGVNTKGRPSAAVFGSVELRFWYARRSENVMHRNDMCWGRSGRIVRIFRRERVLQEGPDLGGGAVPGPIARGSGGGFGYAFPKWTLAVELLDDTHEVLGVLGIAQYETVNAIAK